MLLRTWDDFCLHAAHLFGKDEARKLPLFMEHHCLTKHQVLCFINWAAGMTHREIADELSVTQQAVSKCIAHVHLKWPHIMSHIGPEKMLRYDPKEHDHQVITETNDEGREMRHGTRF